MVELADALTKILGGESTQQNLFITPGPAMLRIKGTPFSVFLRETLSDGKPKTVDEIAEIARRTIPSQTKGKSIHRMINFGLIALRLHGTVEHTEEGWRIRQRNKDRELVSLATG